MDELQEASVAHFPYDGWYWWATEYPDEGRIGPYDRRSRAVAAAVRGGSYVEERGG